MSNIQATCNKCHKQFFIIEKEQQMIQAKGLPLPIWCPSCRQERRLSLRGGRQLFKTKCQKCGKDTIVSFDPIQTKNMILCKQDYDAYFSENDPIISDPLPQL